MEKELSEKAELAEDVQLEKILPPTQFFRTHKSYIVNCTKVISIKAGRTGLINRWFLCSHRGPTQIFIRQLDGPGQLNVLSS